MRKIPYFDTDKNRAGTVKIPDDKEDVKEQRRFEAENQDRPTQLITGVEVSDFKGHDRKEDVAHFDLVKLPDGTLMLYR